MADRECFIYVIGRPDGPVKIGISADPICRVRELQTGCPFRLTILHREPLPSRRKALEIEEMVLAVHCESRLAGEWLNIDGDLATEAVRNAIDIDLHFAERRSAK